MTKRIICITLVFILCFSITGCSQKTVSLDYFNHSDIDLFKLTGKQVTIYGYYMLNNPMHNTVYITDLPYRGIYSPQTELGTSYSKIGLQENGIMVVTFKEQPEYTSALVKITGKLAAGPFYDSQYFTYNYKIEDAIIEEIDPSTMQPALQQYYELSKLGFTDVLYEAIIELDKMLEESENDTAFPEFKEYEEIKEVFKNKKPNMAEKDYLSILDDVNDVYTKYQKIYGTSEYNISYLKTDIEDLFEKFNAYLDAYATF